MNQLKNHEIARVFATYYFAPCIASDGEIGTVNIIGKIPNDTDYYKLLLTPLSSITDEHAINVAYLYGLSNNNDKYTLIETGRSEARNPFLDWKIYQLLIIHNYSVPLFFGLNHWAHGKTPIGLGIAIDKTTHRIEKPASFL